MAAHGQKKPTMGLRFLLLAALALRPCHSLTTNDVVPEEATVAEEQAEFLEVEHSPFAKYRSPKSTIVNLHITHNAGTTLCHWASANGDQFAGTSLNCNAPVSLDAVTLTQQDNPFETAERNKYVMFEYRVDDKKTDLAQANWESPDIISLLVVRDPLERLLAGDGSVLDKYGHPETRSKQQWWAYAKDDLYTRNYQVGILSNHNLGYGATDNNPTRALEKAKALTKRITFVLDQACLNDNLRKFASTLGWKVDTDTGDKGPSTNRPSVEEQINDPELLEFLKKRNREDIEFYQWAKQRSLVQCDESNSY